MLPVDPQTRLTILLVGIATALGLLILWQLAERYVF
jgi:hypothetical protein